ncbi:MAG: peptidylprolyl isomerase [Bacillota bacterium]
MKKVFVALSCFIIAALLMVGCSAKGGSIGTVNGQDISKDVYESIYEQNKAYMEAFGITFDDEQGQAMLSQIEQSAWQNAVMQVLIMQEAEEAGITVSDADVKADLDEVIANNFANDEEYQKYLKESEITEAELLESFRQQAYQTKLYEYITKDVSISEKDAKKNYEEDTKNYDNFETSHILIAVDSSTATDEDWAAAKKQAADLIKELNNGADFATVAKEHSDDGSASDGGVIPSPVSRENSGLYDEYVEEVFKLGEAGKYSSQPVKSSAGYHIIKIDKKNFGFDAIKENLISSLADTKKNEVYSEYMSKKMESAEILRAMTFQYWTEGNELPTVKGYSDPEPAAEADKNAATKEDNDTQEQQQNETNSEETSN